MGVSDLIAKLDAEHIKADADARARHMAELASLEEAAAVAAAAERKALADAESKKLAASVAEREKWRVKDCGEEVRAGIAALKAKLSPPKPKPKIVVKDISTIVLDIGSNSIKAGFAGDDAPLFVVSSVVGHVHGDQLMDIEKHAHVEKDYYVGDEVWSYKDVLSIKRVVKNGVVQNWDDFGLLLDHIFFEEMKISKESLEDYPILLTEPPLSPKSNREKMMVLMFERYNCAAIYMANTATLALYGTGSVTGVVVDCGYDVSTSIAVFEGTVIPDSLRRLDLAGRELDAYMIRLLNERGYRLNELSSFDGFIVRDIKETHCEICSDAEAMADAFANAPAEEFDVRQNGNNLLPGFESKKYPDMLSLGNERFQCGEILFDPRALLGKDLLVPGVQHMVSQTLSTVPIDLKTSMFANIVLSGGTTMMAGFDERLRTDLSELTTKVLVNVLADVQRHIAVWRGGSVLASSKSFNFHWVSREEYAEFGLELAHHSI